jgi:hypothetical protein
VEIAEKMSLQGFLLSGEGLVGAMLSLIALVVVGTMSLIVLDICGTLRDGYTY